MSRAGATHTPYTRLPHLQRPVRGPSVSPLDYAEHAARCAFVKPSSVWTVLLCKAFLWLPFAFKKKSGFRSSIY